MSGHGAGLPDLPGVRTTGRVGENVSIEEGYATARAVILMIVASLKQFTGDLDHLKRVFRLFWHGQMGRPTSGAIRRLSTAQLISSTRFGVPDLVSMPAPPSAQAAYPTISPSKSTASSKSRIEPPVRALRQAQGRGVNTKFSPHPGPNEG